VIRRSTPEKEIHVGWDAWRRPVADYEIHGLIREHWREEADALGPDLPIHRTQATFPASACSTCDGGGCPDCTDPA
jgi:hypothetical protein